MHYTRTVFDFNNVPVTWNMKGEVQAYLNEGINSLNEGNIEGAIGQLTEAVKLDNTLWIAYYYRAVCYKISDKPQEALSDLLEADALHDDQFEINLEIAKVYIILKQGQPAERFLNKAIKIRPADVQAFFTNNLDGAWDFFKKCDEVKPDFPDSKVQMGVISLQRNDMEGGMALFDKAIQLDSMQADARQARLLIRLEARMDLSRALDDANFLLAYNQFHPGWRMARAYLLIQYNDFEAAFRDIKRVLDATAMNQDTFLWRRRRVEQSIDIQNAGRYLSSRIYGLSDKNQVIMKKAFCQIVIGKYDDALKTIATSLQSDTSPAFLYLKGLANELMGYWQDAQPYYNKALARDNDIFDLHRKRGNYHSARQEWAQAEKDFDVMEKLYPDVMVTYRVRGIARYYNKKYKEAFEDLNRYLKSDSMNLECIAFRGRCYQEMGMMMPGLKDLSKGNEFNWIDFNRANDLMDTLVWKEDSERLTEFVGYFSRFFPFPAVSSRAEMLELKLMLAAKLWLQIEAEWNDFKDAPIVRGDKRFGSILFTAYGASLVERRNLNEALQLFTEAIKFDKNNAYAYYERGKLLIQLREIAKATDDLSKALSLGDRRATKYLEQKD